MKVTILGWGLPGSWMKVSSKTTSFPGHFTDELDNSFVFTLNCLVSEHWIVATAVTLLHRAVLLWSDQA